MMSLSYCTPVFEMQEKPRGKADPDQGKAAFRKPVALFHGWNTPGYSALKYKRFSRLFPQPLTLRPET
jgi:hypothetical protein